MSGVVIWCEHECPGWSFDVSTNVRPCQKSRGNECPWERMSGIRNYHILCHFCFVTVLNVMFYNMMILDTSNGQWFYALVVIGLAYGMLLNCGVIFLTLYRCLALEMVIQFGNKTAKVYTSCLLCYCFTIWIMMSVVPVYSFCYWVHS